MKLRFVLLGPEEDPDGRAGGPQFYRGRGVRYEESGSNIIRVEDKGSGELKSAPVTNFRARIVRDIVIDDGEDSRRRLGVEAKLAGNRITCSMSGAEFSRMGWVLDKLGPQAIIYPGQQQHARTAIQWLSGQIRQERIFAHLGWRKNGADWVYLDATGAIGADGQLDGLQVQVPTALQCYQVRAPQAHDELVASARASLRFLSVAPDRISFPLLAAVYRAPFGKLDFSIFLAGETGTFKTALAAVCQQHFGAEMDASCLPANFASTANALESLAFTAKDALMVVDDFVPMGGDNVLQSLAERLFRAAGNRQGRNRMGGGGRLRSPQMPRALLLATGEEVPRGQSLRARLLIVDIEQREVDRDALNECQHDAQQGCLSSAMGGFLAWMASRYEELQRLFEARTKELRGDYRSAVHTRIPTALASLQSGFEIWLQFAVEAGAIGTVEQVELQHRTRRALSELAALQTRYHEASDPAQRFVTLLRAALGGGRAHVANRLGKAPESPGVWGWRAKQTGHGWVAKGPRIGWTTGTDLFLDSALSYRIVQVMAGHESLPLSEQTLRHRMRERGLLASIDPGRQMLQVRRTLEGRPRLVLHLKANEIAG